MRTDYGECIVHYLVQVWYEENGLRNNTKIEIEFLKVHGDPQLILELKDNRRPILEWLEESFTLFLEDDPTTYLPNIEICEDPIIVEVIGKVRITGSFDYWGEYDEDCELEIQQWSIDIED